MNTYVTGATIKMLREKKEYTQKQLADILQVSDKTISKWETSKGLPDISLIEPLAKALGISITELLSGECMVNQNKSGNMLRSRFYVCPICGNVIFASGEGAFSCCGVMLPPIEADKSEEIEESESIHVEESEGEYWVSLLHPMEKTHYISFIAYATSDRVELVKLYPEQEAFARFSKRGHGRIYAYCNHPGLNFITV